jgi:putative ABC transport system permease protein
MASVSNSPMRKVSLRNLAAHKVRLALTVLSVVLGTAFVAGSFVFTDTLQKTFDSIFENTAQGVDVRVSMVVFRWRMSTNLRRSTASER